MTRWDGSSDVSPNCFEDGRIPLIFFETRMFNVHFIIMYDDHHVYFMFGMVTSSFGQTQMRNDFLLDVVRNDFH